MGLSDMELTENVKRLKDICFQLAFLREMGCWWFQALPVSLRHNITTPWIYLNSGLHVGRAPRHRGGAWRTVEGLEKQGWNRLDSTWTFGLSRETRKPNHFALFSDWDGFCRGFRWWTHTPLFSAAKMKRLDLQAPMFLRFLSERWEPNRSGRFESSLMSRWIGVHSTRSRCREKTDCLMFRGAWLGLEGNITIIDLMLVFPSLVSLSWLPKNCVYIYRFYVLMFLWNGVLLRVKHVMLWGNRWLLRFVASGVVHQRDALPPRARDPGLQPRAFDECTLTAQLF